MKHRCLKSHSAKTAATLAPLLFALLAATSASAQNWTGGGDGVSWSQTLNWFSLPVSGPATSLSFSNAGALNTNQNLGSPFTFYYLSQNTAGALAITGNALEMAGNTPQMYINGAGSTFSAPFILSGTNNNYIQGTDLTLSGGVSGAGKLYASGLVTLSGPGTWTGGTEIQGTLRATTANALPTANVMINGSGILEFILPTAGSWGGSLIYSGGGTFKQNGPGTLTLTGDNSNFSYGTISVESGRTLITGATGALGGYSTNVIVKNTATLQAAQANLGGQTTITVQNGGLLQALATQSTGTGQTVIQNGGLVEAGAALSTSGSTTVNSGGILRLTANDGIGSQVTVQAGGTVDGNGFTQATAFTLTNAGNVALPAGSQLNAGSGTWTGTTSGAGVMEFGNGYRNLNAGTNLAHTGGTVFSNGFTGINTSNVLPDTGTLTMSGGQLYHYGTETVDSVVVTGGYLATTNFTTTGTLDLQGGDVSGALTVTGAITKTTAGTATISGPTLNMLAGGTVSAGTLTIQNTVVSGAFTNNATLDAGYGTTLNGSTINTGTLNNNGTLAGPVTNSGTLTNSNSITANIANTGTVNSNGGGISGNISGIGNLTATGSSTLSGINNYSGGSVATSANVSGTTDSIQGSWALTNSQLNFYQVSPGTMAGTISGSGGAVMLAGSTQITLSGANSFTGGVQVATGTTFGIGSNTAAGTGGTIQGINDLKMKAEGGARTLANPLALSTATTEIIGANNLTFTDATGKTLANGATLTHNSSGTTAIGGTFLGQNTSQINVNNGTLKLGAAVNNGFRMDGALNVAAGATLQMISNSFVKLGPTNLNGGTLVAANGVAIPTGLALNATGSISGRVASEAGSVIDATGPLSMGDSLSFAGFFSNGELRENSQGVTISDKNQAVLGSLTTVGQPGISGTLTAVNGMFVDFGRGIEGYGTVASANTLAQATIINGDAAGNSGAEMLNFSGYVKGVGSFNDVSFSGTFSPGLSPAIVSVGSIALANSSTLIIEIGGLAPGSQHDQIDIGGTVALGGLLDVDLINGFNPALGDSFLILDGNTTGGFSGFSFPAINPGLAWDTSDLYSNGLLKIAAIPEPGTYALGLVGLAAALRRRRVRG